MCRTSVPGHHAYRRRNSCQCSTDGTNLCCSAGISQAVCMLIHEQASTASHRQLKLSLAIIWHKLSGLSLSKACSPIYSISGQFLAVQGFPKLANSCDSWPIRGLLRAQAQVPPHITSLAQCHPFETSSNLHEAELSPTSVL